MTIRERETDRQTDRQRQRETERNRERPRVNALRKKRWRKIERRRRVRQIQR